MNAAEARVMHALALQHPKLTAMIVPSPVANPWEPAVKRVLDSGRLGSVFFCEVRPHLAARQPSSQAGRQAGKQAGKQAGRQAGRQAHT